MKSLNSKIILILKETPQFPFANSNTYCERGDQERAKVKRSTYERGDCSKLGDSNTCFPLEEVGSFGILHFPWQKTMAILRLFSNANVAGRERGLGFFFFIGLAIG